MRDHIIKEEHVLVEVRFYLGQEAFEAVIDGTAHKKEINQDYDNQDRIELEVCFHIGCHLKDYAQYQSIERHDQSRL
jgi:hypothetical protein